MFQDSEVSSSVFILWFCPVFSGRKVKTRLYQLPYAITYGQTFYQCVILCTFQNEFHVFVEYTNIVSRLEADVFRQIPILWGSHKDLCLCLRCVWVTLLNELSVSLQVDTSVTLLAAFLFSGAVYISAYNKKILNSWELRILGKMHWSGLIMFISYVYIFKTDWKRHERNYSNFNFVLL